MEDVPNTIPVRVDNRIRMPFDALTLRAASDLKAAHEYPNPEIGKRIGLGYSTRGIPDVIRTWLVKDGVLSLPRGGMRRVRKILSDNQLPFVVTDARTEGQPITHPLRYKGFELREHQREMVRVGLAREQCILRGATGSGKTVAAFALAVEIGLNTLIILPTKGLFDQWAEWADKVLGIRGNSLGIIQGKKKRLRPLTIAMQATLGKGVPEDVCEFFGAVIVDETQRAAAATLYTAVDSMPARYRIGISASEKRKDKKEFLTYDLFSEVAYEATRDAMTKAGHIVDVEIRIVPTKHRSKHWGQGIRGDFNKLLSGLTEDQARNELAYQFIDHELAANEQVIVLTHRREHVRDIDRRFVEHQIASGCLLGDSEPGDAEEFTRSKRGIEEGTIRVGVGTYGALGYGIDLPAVTVGVAMTPIHTNEQNFNQVRGRLCRTNPKTGKTQGRMYVLADLLVYGLKLIKNILAWNKSVVVWNGETWQEGKDYVQSVARRGWGKRAS